MIQTRLPIEPDGTNNPASRPNISAARCCKRLTLGSSMNTSSPTSASAIARRIAADGLVTVSLRKSIILILMAMQNLRPVKWFLSSRSASRLLTRGSFDLFYRLPRQRRPDKGVVDAIVLQPHDVGSLFDGFAHFSLQPLLHTVLLDHLGHHVAMTFIVVFVRAEEVQSPRRNPGIVFLDRFTLLFHTLRPASLEDKSRSDRYGPMTLLHQRNIHLQSSANRWQRLVIQDFIGWNAQSAGKLHPELAMTGIFASEQIFSFFFHHVFQ